MIRCHLSVLSLPREQRRPSRRSRQPIPPTSRSSKRQKALPLSFPHWTDRIFRFLKISSTNLPAVCAIISFTETCLTFVVFLLWLTNFTTKGASPLFFICRSAPLGGGDPACRRPGARYFFRNYFTLTTLTNRKYAARATTASQSVRRWPQLLSLRKRYFSTCLCI